MDELTLAGRRRRRHGTASGSRGQNGPWCAFTLCFSQGKITSSLMYFSCLFFFLSISNRCHIIAHNRLLHRGRQKHYFNRCPINISEKNTPNLGQLQNTTNLQHLSSYRKTNCVACDPSVAREPPTAYRQRQFWPRRPRPSLVFHPPTLLHCPVTLDGCRSSAAHRLGPVAAASFSRFGYCSERRSP